MKEFQKNIWRMPYCISETLSQKLKENKFYYVFLDFFGIKKITTEASLKPRIGSVSGDVGRNSKPVMKVP